MPPKDEIPAPQRRRGAALETALLDAAWDEIVEKGYDGFTIESVAERAQTSRAVIYRRWATKPDLVRAAALHGMRREPASIPDTGSLREDVIALLKGANRTRARYGLLVLLQLNRYFAETGSSFADLREDFIGGRTTALAEIVARGVERGEADPARLTDRVVNVPFDLYRQELLMTLKPVPDEVIESIVDEVFLPLVRPA
ncbi:TetR/AcrR family transcriptional regulator [Gryllotalpicola ginsengisoli]|uniref:TetR/AcrR family transcriptional regulator n=1 Tax=Gryllotalpicola ginsengisoli TaxID=444608 RepID=UPI0003B4A401|nr:TetR/AcrR family transcriptional regulator [Gryllotalpicola ginsengisoli]